MISVDITYDNLETEHYEIKIANNKANLHRVMTRFIAYSGEDDNGGYHSLYESNTKVSLWYFNDDTGTKISAWYYKDEETEKQKD